MSRRTWISSGPSFAAVPAHRLAALRILICGFALVYLLARARHLSGFSRFAAQHFAPVGPVAALDGPLPAGLVVSLYVLAVASQMAAFVGLRFWLSGPLAAASLLWVTSYRSSWGMIFHTENLLVLHSLVIGISPAARVWSLDATRAPGSARTWRVSAAPLHVMNLACVTTYVIAGLAKLQNSGWEWMSGDVLRGHIAYDAVRKIELGSLHSPLGAALVPHAWLFAPLAVFTLLFEFGAPLALFSRRIAVVWCASAWAFHLGVLLLMLIVFPYPLSGIAFAPFFAIERPVNKVLRSLRANWTRWRKSGEPEAEDPRRRSSANVPRKGPPALKRGHPTPLKSEDAS